MQRVSAVRKGPGETRDQDALFKEFKAERDKREKKQ
jgi:hypothetical protein